MPNNEPTEQDKLIIGYLAAGNSAYDLAKMVIDLLVKDAYNDMLDAIDKQEAELPGVKQSYLDTYKVLADDANTVLAG